MRNLIAMSLLVVLMVSSLGTAQAQQPDSAAKKTAKDSITVLLTIGDRNGPIESPLSTMWSENGISMNQFFIGWNHRDTLKGVSIESNVGFISGSYAKSLEYPLNRVGTFDSMPIALYDCSLKITKNKWTADLGLQGSSIVGGFSTLGANNPNISFPWTAEMTPYGLAVASITYTWNERFSTQSGAFYDPSAGWYAGIKQTSPWLNLTALASDKDAYMALDATQKWGKFELKEMVAVRALRYYITKPLYYGVMSTTVSYKATNRLNINARIDGFVDTGVFRDPLHDDLWAYPQGTPYWATLNPKPVVGGMGVVGTKVKVTPSIELCAEGSFTAFNRLWLGEDKRSLYKIYIVPSTQELFKPHSFGFQFAINYSFARNL